MTPLALYNTRTRRKQVFVPLQAGRAGVYTCGPTVYAPQHIGNLRSQLFADLLKRALLAEQLNVTHVINITDVGHLTDDADAGEDKMERAAAARGQSAAEIASQYTEQWLTDRAAVVWPKNADPVVLFLRKDAGDELERAADTLGVRTGSVIDAYPTRPTFFTPLISR